MDAFSEMLNAVKLHGAVYFNAEFSAPWGVITPGSAALAPSLAPGARSLVVYHFVLDGGAFALIPDGPSMTLEPGDVIVFPHGDRHLLSSGTQSKDPQQTLETIQKIKAHDLSVLRAGGGGATTRFVCGFMACDPQLGRTVLDGLPQMFKVNIRADRSSLWLEHSILHLVEQTASGTMGSEAILAKLAEALFVDALRRYVTDLPEQQQGWLAGARDPVVGKSLGLLHRRVNHPWTLADLANEVGVSRSTLVERFTRYLSEPPMTYLARWRLQLAAQALTRTPKSVAEISAGVGYESEAAFNRAFKREFGLPPARYRKEQRSAAAAGA